MIKRQRDYSKKSKTKTISIPIQIDDVHIISRVILRYNPSTERVCISAHGLGCGKGCYIYPTTNQKLRCTNQHAIDMLKKARNLARERKEKKRNTTNKKNMV